MLCGHIAWAHGNGADPGKADTAPARTAPYDPDKAKAASQISDPEVATRAYLDAVSPERRAQTKSYAAGQYVLHAFKPFGADASFAAQLCHSCHATVKVQDYIFTAYPRRTP